MVVLQWIIEGCPEGVVEGSTYKKAAYSLRDRRLIVVSKGGGSWSATPTDAGRYYARHGRYPDGRWTAVPLPTATASERDQAQPRPVAADPARPQRPPTRDTGSVPVSRQLVFDVIAAGGSLVMQGQPYQLLTRIEARVRTAIRRQYVPEGKILSARSTGPGSVVVELTDQPAWMTATLAPIEVPANLRRPRRDRRATRRPTSATNETGPPGPRLADLPRPYRGPG